MSGNQQTMPDKLVKTPCDELTYKIIGCAMSVHRKLGPGLREDTYQRDLAVRFTDEKLAHHHDRKLLEVYDTGQGNVLIGYYIPDFIVGDLVVVEIKALNN